MIINLFYKLQINFIKYFTILFISILITSPIYSQKLSSKAYKVAYMDKGNTITSKNTGKIFPIASLVKLPLVLIADDYFQKEDYIKVPSIKLIYYKPESRANILVGEEYKYSDLLYGLLLPSGNDIARVLEHELKSKGKNFTDLASNWIKKNSLEYTSIKEPIGLSSATSSNIIDLWKILEISYRNDSVYEILNTTKYSFKSKSGLPIKVEARNPLWEYKGYYIRGKTGTTKKAGQCFLGFIMKDRKVFGAAIIGAKDISVELKKIINYISKKGL